MFQVAQLTAPWVHVCRIFQRPPGDPAQGSPASSQRVSQTANISTDASNVSPDSKQVRSPGMLCHTVCLHSLWQGPALQAPVHMQDASLLMAHVHELLNMTDPPSRSAACRHGEQQLHCAAEFRGSIAHCTCGHQGGWQKTTLLDRHSLRQQEESQCGGAQYSCSCDQTWQP